MYNLYLTKSRVMGLISITLLTVYAVVYFTNRSKDPLIICTKKAKEYGIVLDKLEKYVIIGYGKTPFCPLPHSNTPRSIKAGESMNFWLRSVYYDQVSKPAPNTRIILDVIDSRGKAINAKELGISIHPNKILTGDDGFYKSAILSASDEAKLEVIRIRATYLDKAVWTVSYSSVILIEK